MAMTPEQMADALADEMIEDLDKISSMLLQFHDRYMQYSTQFGALVSDKKKEQVEQALIDFYQKMESFVEDEE